MQKSTIIVLILILLAVVGMLVSLLGASSYATFADAAASPGESVTIIGELNKEKSITYDPAMNENLTQFYVIDKAGVEQLVTFHKPRPRDIEKSEEITMEGKMINGEFHAVHILLKCPSKYNPKELGVDENYEREYSAPIPK